MFAPLPLCPAGSGTDAGAAPANASLLKPSFGAFWKALRAIFFSLAPKKGPPGIRPAAPFPLFCGCCVVVRMFPICGQGQPQPPGPLPCPRGRFLSLLPPFGSFCREIPAGSPHRAALCARAPGEGSRACAPGAGSRAQAAGLAPLARAPGLAPLARQPRPLCAVPHHYWLTVTVSV